MAQLENRTRHEPGSDPSQPRRGASSRVLWRPRLIEGNPAARRNAACNAKPPVRRRRKRVFDIVFGAALVVFLAPLMLIIAALVKLDGGPILYGHRRVGANGRSFRCWKFRSMVVDADKVLADVLRSDPEARRQWEQDFKLKSDPRITRIGRFLRTTSLDELPQLFNVIKGEMSLIGPRPIVTEEIERYGDAFRNYWPLAGERSQRRRLRAPSQVRRPICDRLVFPARPRGAVSDSGGRHAAKRGLLG